MTDKPSAALRTVGDVQKALHPLQKSADRLGKQVEEFAESLDRLSKRSTSRSKDCRHVLPLVQRYEDIATETVRWLRDYHEPEGHRFQSSRHSLRSSTSRASTTSRPPLDFHTTTIRDLLRWEEERQTWQLLRLMLQVTHPIRDEENQPRDQDTKFNRPRPIDRPLDPYDSEQTVWKSYLAQKDDAWEQHVVLEWLKDCAESSRPDIDRLVAPLESGADRGSGLWAHGWLYSKEAIKGQKRLRSWPQPLDPTAQGLNLSLVNADRTQELVTQLDPDAITRQGRHLEKEDLQFERATWLACWEMLRRGRSWTSICEWCQERVEGWRAISMRGDPRYSDATSDISIGHQSRTLWRSMCAQAALHGIDPYENAVYGVLSGHLTSVEKVAKSWDDHFFAYYNSSLLNGFDLHIERVLDHGSRKLNESTSDPTTLTGLDLMRKLINVESLRREGQRPMKSFQSSLICKSFWKFAEDYGSQVGKLSREDPRSIRMDDESKARSGTLHIFLKDHDFLRVVAHTLLIFMELEPDMPISPDIETILEFYVEYLSKAGKQQLLPLYASKLSTRTKSRCMARQLPFILESTERKTTVKLMNQYGFNLVHVCFLQLILLISDSRIPSGLGASFPVLKILDRERLSSNPTDNAIMNGFMGGEIRGDEMDLINGFDWFLLIEGHWKETMAAGCLVYKHFLRESS